MSGFLAQSDPAQRPLGAQAGRIAQPPKGGHRTAVAASGHQGLLAFAHGHDPRAFRSSINTPTSCAKDAQVRIIHSIPYCPASACARAGGRTTPNLATKCQTLYLSIGGFPVAPDKVAYPRSFENTLLAFLVFSGIYLLISMTASILREQVSA
jgi:hypothetical protein